MATALILSGACLAGSSTHRRRRARSAAHAVARFVRNQVRPATLQRAVLAPVVDVAAAPVQIVDRHLIVKQIANDAVEIRSVGALKHHLQVVALLPVSLRLELLLHEIVELRARQRIRDADADVIGAGTLEKPAGRENAFQLLSQVAELDEEPDANALLSKARARARNVLDSCALVHRIEDFLAAALATNPTLAASGALQFPCHGTADEVGARLNREGYGAARRVHRGGKVCHPIHAESEDVVGKPDVVGIEGVLQIGHFGGDVCRRALEIAVSPDRFGAPVAAEGTTA